MADRDAYIVSACRTAIGEFMGGLASMTAPQLGAIAIREAVKRAGVDPAEVDEVLMGNVVKRASGRRRRGRPPSTAEFPTASRR